jgi:hypothetical protein
MSVSNGGLFMDTAVRGSYSEPRVLRSAAGHYVGTMWEEFDAAGVLVWQEPGSRDSQYFANEKEAADWLVVYNRFQSLQ